MACFYPLPPDIRAKVALLKRHREAIEQLDRQCQQLEEDIQVYRLQAAPVKRCPPEILLMIFKVYLSEDPRVIRRLLLVSRQWFETAISNPTLWTNILVVLDTRKEVAMAVAKSTIPWIEACLERSGALPLSLNIDLRNMHTIRGYFSDRGRALFPYDLCYKVWEDGVDHYLKHPESDIVINSRSWHPKHHTPVFSLLAGPGHQHMERWSGLNLWLPKECRDGVFMRPMWQMLAGFTPNLTHLSIQGDGYFDIDPNLVVKSKILPDLSSLKSLTLERKNPMTYFKIPIGKIESLDLACYSPADVHNLRKFVHLRDLTLCDCIPFRENLSTLELQLPHLKGITFKRCLDTIAAVRFTLPALLSLCLSDIDHIYNPSQLPKLYPQILSWFGPSYRGHTSQRALEYILLQFTTIKSLIIPDFIEPDLKIAIKKLEEEGKLPRSFALVRIVSDDDHEKELRTWSIG